VGSVGVRTAAGGVLSIPVVPADVIGRCDRCRCTYREGDWYCTHLAVRYGHAIAWLADLGDGDTASVTVEPAATLVPRGRPAGFAVSFASPTL
jgi:hypothetical protein